MIGNGGEPCTGLTLLLVAVAAVPARAEAQDRPSWSWQTEPPFAANYRQDLETGPVSHTLLSLALPGLGQHRQGKARKWIFAGLEVAAWSVYFERRSAGGALRNDYRDFAWEEGRLQAGTRVDGDFNYYETLSKWNRSGAFDRDAGLSGLQPEEDPATFNGTIWVRAQSIFLGGDGPPGDAGFAQALEYYEARAYEIEFLWDWSRRPADRARLGELISESDSRFVQATTAVGIVIANHLVSAVDAFLGSRGIASLTNIHLAPRWTPEGGGWSAKLSVPIGSTGPSGH